VIDAASHGVSGPLVYPMPYKQNQDCADDGGHQGPNEAEHRDTQQTGKHTAHKRPEMPTRILVKMLLSDSVTFSATHPAIAPIRSIERKPISGWPRNACASSIETSHVPRSAMATSLPSLSTEEAVKHVLNIVEVLLSGVSARLEMLPEDCRPCTAHHAQLLA
jgi:hypothetical protein